MNPHRLGDARAERKSGGHRPGDGPAELAKRGLLFLGA